MFSTFADAGNGVLAIPMTNNGYSVCQGGVCVWGEGDLPNPNIRHVPQPETEADKAAAAERDRKWVEDCHPKLIRDPLGVMRYEYMVPGCEYGSRP